MILYLIIFFILYIILYGLNSLYLNKENFDTEEYKKLMLNNNKKNLYKIKLDKNIKMLRDDCYEKCNKQDCLLLDDKTKWLNKCVKCNLQDKKCFNKSIIGGNCDDCNIENIEDKLDCFSNENYGCPAPDNINDLNINRGIMPYFIEVPDNNVNSPFNKKCVFCWNLMDNI